MWRKNAKFRLFFDSRNSEGYTFDVGKLLPFQWCGILDEQTGLSIIGDINGDGTINVIDIVMTVDLILNNNYDSVADINEDGLLNVLDVVILIDWILNP